MSAAGLLCCLADHCLHSQCVYILSSIHLLCSCADRDNGDCRKALGVQCCEGHGDAINDISVHPTKPTLVLTASRVRTDLCRNQIRTVCRRGVIDSALASYSA